MVQDMGSGPIVRSRKVPAGEWDSIKERYLDGEPAKVLAQEYGVTVSYLRTCLPRRPNYAKR